MTRRARVLGAAVALGSIFLAVQLVPVERANPPVVSEIVAPGEVAAILETSCYDCHSHETRWPWYAYVAPSSWFVAGHVRDARADMNLTDWPFDLESQQFYLAEMKRQIEEGEMPLPSYLWLHSEARLSEGDRQRLLEWLEEEARMLHEASLDWQRP